MTNDSKKKSEMGLLDHLEELRTRLFICISGLVVTTAVSFAFVDFLRSLLTRPAGDMTFIYTRPAEALMANIRVAFIAGVIFAMPLILTQFILFISPALYKNEKKVIIPTVLAMLLFFVLGFSFAYYTVLPFAIRFFIGFASHDLTPMFTISEYLGFATQFLFSFGFVFQMPLVFLFLGKLNIVTPGFLRKNRKYALLIIFVFAAILTPPDVFSQIMMAVPLMFLYELGIMLVVISQRRRKKEDDWK
ncbi:MAG: twin-arginine translocase subunit TatC [Dethiobacter sp.]|nr:twin-arginine translocase subunit TatC [Dethiobacter sp.]